jgi:hypothetical protein
MRRKITWLLSIMVATVLITRWMRQPEYDWGFLDDDSEDILGATAATSKHGHQPGNTKAPESSHDESGPGKQARAINKKSEPMSQGGDGLTRVGDWEGRHPLFEVIQRAEDDFRKEIASRPATVRL